MDIVFLVDNNVSTVGGVQESTKIIIEGVFDTNSKCTLIQPGLPSEFKSDIVIEQPIITKIDQIKKVFKNPFLFIKYAFKTFKIIKSTNPKIVHTQGQVSFFLVALFRKLRLLPRHSAFIHTERGVYNKYSAFFKKLFIFFMNELDVLIFTTKNNKRLWENALKSKSYSINYKVIHNTAGHNFYTAKPKELPTKITFGFAGRYCDVKNWPLAEQIIEQLIKQGLNFQVSMAVGCLDEDSNKKTQEMFSRIEKELGKKFKGVTNLPFSKMRKFYDNIDIFILTSEPGTESFGRTVVEAMSAGCIVYVTPGGGPPEVVGDPNFVYENTEKLITKLHNLLNDHERFKLVSVHNIERASSFYSLESSIINHRKLYAQFGCPMFKELK